MKAINILCLTTICCLVSTFGCASRDTDPQQWANARETTVSLEKSQGPPVPFEGLGEPVSTQTIKFEKLVKTLHRGASRATVLKCVGASTRRRALIPATSTVSEIAPKLLVRGPDFRWGPELKKGEKKQHEVWIYEFYEGEQSVSVSISSFSGTGHQKGTTRMQVIRQYNLYFAEDSLEKVEVGLSASQTHPKSK